MDAHFLARGPAVAALLLASTGCAAFDRAAGTNTGAVYPARRDGTPANPPCTAATRVLDRAAGTDTGGAHHGRLSEDLERALRRALSLAAERKHEYATLEHLLLALVEDAEVAAVLQACGAHLDRLRADLIRFLDVDLSGLVTDSPGPPKPTDGFGRVVTRAALHVQVSGPGDVDVVNVLVALFSEDESHAVRLLRAQNVDRRTVIDFLRGGGLRRL